MPTRGQRRRNRGAAPARVVEAAAGAEPSAESEPSGSVHFVEAAAGAEPSAEPEPSKLRQARSQARRPNRRGRGRRGAKREQTPEPPEAEPPSLEDTHDLPDIADPLLRATVSAAFASLIDGRAKGPPMQGDRGVFSVGPAPGKDINNIIIVHLPEKGAGEAHRERE